MNSDPDPPSSSSQPHQHLGRSRLNAAAVDHSENNQKSGPSQGDTATFSSSGPGYSHSREKAEKNVQLRIQEISESIKGFNMDEQISV